MSVELEILNQLKRGITILTKQKFRNALKRSVKANKNYADAYWIYFQDSPLHYLCSRRPERQAEELIKVCMKLGKG